MEYKFARNRSDKIPKPKILEQLEKVAQKKNFVEFSADDFNELADISAGTVKNEFGSWLNALKALKEHLNQKGLEFTPRESRSQLSLLTDKELFDEMERIWRQLGHRSSCIEWKSSNPKINKGVYRYRFSCYNFNY